ncbi:MAG: hypothetical protein IJH03_03760 [Clostridia bacterium]|nr:hypothetical protein [Clostridia bacterium]MBQ6325637.1 hypothetical protein [Clostridia bacterium]
MKYSSRLVIVILMVVLLIQSVGYAEQPRFSIRNGIMFGLSKDDIIIIEDRNNSGSYKEVQIDNGERLVFHPNTLAGVEDGAIRYDFINDQLESIDYNWRLVWFRDSDNSTLGKFNLDKAEEKYKSIYTEIRQTLDNKYKKIGYMDGKNSFKYVDLGGVDLYAINNLESSNSKEIVFGFDEYIASDGDNYVIIALECFRLNMYDSYKHDEIKTISYEVLVNYVPVDKQEYDEYINAKKNSIIEKENDL